TATCTIAINVTAGPTDPSGSSAATPASVLPGEISKLTVTVTPGANPVSSGIVVTGDLTSIGGSATQQFFDNGTNGDVTAGNNVFTFSAAVAKGNSGGGKTSPFR